MLFLSASFGSSIPIGNGYNNNNNNNDTFYSNKNTIRTITTIIITTTTTIDSELFVGIELLYFLPRDKIEIVTITTIIIIIIIINNDNNNNKKDSNVCESTFIFPTESQIEGW